MRTIRPEDCIACVVLYKPGQEALAVVRILKRQFSHVYVYKNSSIADEFAGELSLLGVRELGNGQNVGLGAAYNAIVIDITKTFPEAKWLAIFDQDSTPPSSYVENMVSVLNQCAGLPIIACGVCFIDNNSNVITGKGGYGYSFVESLISSGTMHSIEGLISMNGFSESLFIDYVDHEYFFRARSRKWMVIRAEAVIMRHCLGRATSHKLLWFLLVTSNYPPLRLFYQTRNRLMFARQYALFDMGWVAKDLWALLKTISKIILLEEGKFGKIGAIMSGVAHAGRIIAAGNGKLYIR